MRLSRETSMIWFLAIDCVSFLFGSMTKGRIPHHADNTSPLLTEKKIQCLKSHTFYSKVLIFIMSTESSNHSSSLIKPICMKKLIQLQFPEKKKITQTSVSSGRS